MKNTDLMIGDWVYLPEDPFKEYYYKVNNLNDSKSLIQGFFLSRFEPIPLTEEILKVNGITNEQYTFYDGYNFELHNGAKDSVSVGALWYVHELQHALRLCGLNELADNFMLKAKE